MMVDEVKIGKDQNISLHCKYPRGISCQHSLFKKDIYSFFSMFFSQVQLNFCSPFPIYANGLLLIKYTSFFKTKIMLISVELSNFGCYTFPVHASTVNVLLFLYFQVTWTQMLTTPEKPMKSCESSYFFHRAISLLSI